MMMKTMMMIFNEDEIIMLTPKGYMQAQLRVFLDIDEETFDTIWENFKNFMDKYYLR